MEGGRGFASDLDVRKNALVESLCQQCLAQRYFQGFLRDAELLGLQQFAFGVGGLSEVDVDFS